MITGLPVREYDSMFQGINMYSLCRVQQYPNLLLSLEYHVSPLSPAAMLRIRKEPDRTPTGLMQHPSWATLNHKKSVAARWFAFIAYIYIYISISISDIPNFVDQKLMVCFKDQFSCSHRILQMVFQADLPAFPGEQMHLWRSLPILTWQ